MDKKISKYKIKKGEMKLKEFRTTKILSSYKLKTKKTEFTEEERLMYSLFLDPNSYIDTREKKNLLIKLTRMIYISDRSTFTLFYRLKKKIEKCTNEEFENFKNTSIKFLERQP